MHMHVHMHTHVHIPSPISKVYTAAPNMHLCKVGYLADSQ